MAKRTLHKELGPNCSHCTGIAIDGPPRINEHAKSIILAAGVDVIPVQPSPADVWATAETADLVNEARMLTPNALSTPSGAIRRKNAFLPLSILTLRAFFRRRVRFAVGVRKDRTRRRGVGYTRRMLVCTVRGCGLALEKVDGGRRVVCGRGHSFDASRSGYINLLQPQDRRARVPGDAAEAVRARRRLHDRGVSRAMVDAVKEMLGARAGEAVLDAGCGEGFYLGTLAREAGIEGHGVDISTAAIEAAARRYPECEWIVANADRFVPYAEGTFDAVMTITGRMNAAELRRVVKEGGRVLVGVAGPEDLIELRGTGKDRGPKLREVFGPGFEPAGERRVTAKVELDAEGVRDARTAIYRPLGRGAEGGMRVTLSLDLMLFRAA